jgi:hypothetical protein
MDLDVSRPECSTSTSSLGVGQFPTAFKRLVCWVVAESTVDRAGVANEAGSVHRRNVAVFLAVHGLTGKAVLGGIPASLAFETAHKTDDIFCVLDTGSRLFISAKRTCGVTKPFKETVADWAKTSFEVGDRLVLATAEPKGSVCPAPGLMETLNTRRIRSHGGTTEVSGRVA